MLIRIPKGWEIPEREATSESAYLDRRRLLQTLGFLGLEGLSFGAEAPPSVFAAKRNPEFTLDRPLSSEAVPLGYNNYYEFHPTDKQAVQFRIGAFKPNPWSIEVGGLVAKPQTFDIDALVKTMPLEERLYRFRCVEAWSMAVPWTGFPISELVRKVEPKPEAKFIRFVTVNRPKEMPGMGEANWYPWPYFEGLRMDEAMNPLALFVVGLYGKALPKQNGAPIRVITPWKYGYKSIKSIVKIEFVAKRPATFWNQLQPGEYGFYSNVNPAKPHPRWSQASERFIQTPNQVERRPTLPFNGYGQWVAGMYKGDPDS